MSWDFVVIWGQSTPRSHNLGPALRMKRARAQTPGFRFCFLFSDSYNNARPVDYDGEDDGNEDVDIGDDEAED